jgi:hypothetical protein
MQFQHLWKNSSRSLNVLCVSQTNKAAYECEQLASKQFYETSFLKKQFFFVGLKIRITISVGVTSRQIDGAVSKENNAAIFREITTSPS